VPGDTFAATFSTLRGILEQHSRSLLVQVDKSGDYQVALPDRKDRAGRPLAAAAVQINKNYVSYHLMGLYAVRDLLEDMSPALRRRMQGKSCFNFTTIDRGQADELSVLTERSLAALSKATLPWENR
jgi:hypothetical protein